MNNPQTLLRSTLLLTVGQVASYGLAFVRNIILARTLAKADFGLAAAFSMTVSLLEVAGRMSLGQQIVQSRDGDSEAFQASSHAFQFLLAVTGAVFIVLLGGPLAHAFKAPNAAWAFMLLAIVPLSRGLEHLSYYRVQRELRYLPAVLCEVVPQAFATFLAWPLAAYLKSFSVLTWLMTAKALTTLVMTHITASEPYRWSWRSDYVRGMWGFGWPLLLTGLLVFASQQADQIVVGSFFSLEVLATYALALSIASIPWFLFGQVASSIMLPVLSRAQHSEEEFQKRYASCVEYAAVCSVGLSLPLILGGEQIVTVLYGSKYTGTGTLLALLGAASCVRFLRFVPAVASMGRADTMNQLYSNLWRGVSLPLCLTAVLLGGPVVLVATSAVAAELAAGLVSVLRLKKCQGVPLSTTARAAAYVLCSVGPGTALVHSGAYRWSAWLMSAVVTGALFVSLF